MENIYNLVPEQVVERPKPPMYRSRHDPTAPVPCSTFGTQGTTQLAGASIVKRRTSANFGPPSQAPPDPTRYLKRGERTADTRRRLREAAESSFRYPEQARKPAVPRAQDVPIMGIRTSKNFITANAVEAILQVPQGVPEREPDYLNKADYGRVPEYLTQVKEEIRRENEMIDQYVMDMGRGAGGFDEEEHLDPLPDSERRELVRALKAKWDAVNARYQKMCHIVKLDSVGKVKRKEALEKELTQIEQDIEKLECHGPVYVH